MAFFQKISGTGKRLVAVILAVCLMVGQGSAAVIYAEESAGESEAVLSEETLELSMMTDNRLPEGTVTYAEYKESNGKKKELRPRVVLNVDEARMSEGVFCEEVDGEQALVYSAEGDWAEWTVKTSRAGMYSIRIMYRAAAGRSEEVGFSLAINGEVPFYEADNLLLSRIWEDDLDPSKPFFTDAIGNDVSPEKKEVFRWNTEVLYDREGREAEPYRFLFKKGQNTLRLTGVQDCAAIAQVILYNEDALPSYEEYASKFDRSELSEPIGHVEKIQAERAAEYSSTVLTAGYDRSSVATEPASAAVIRRNTLGGSNWCYAGQWVTWNITVPKDGYYTITLKYRQNFVRGLYTTRRIYLDGETPFAELSRVKFLYSGSWECLTLGTEEEPYYFWLEAGTHTITAEVVPGDMTESLEVFEQTWEELTQLYQRIVMITGASPDIYFDYTLATDIPDLIDTVRSVSHQLRDEVDKMESVLGKSGSEANVVEKLADQLDDFAANHYTIASRLSEFRENISALASWIQSRREQPLELDYIAVCSADQTPPEAGANFFSELWYQIELFVYSFFMNYNNVGGETTSGEQIEVWVSGGRDQMYILRSLIDNDLAKQENAPAVTLKLVNASILPQAIMAGIGPDVALDVSRSLPVDMALRGVLEPLDNYSEFETIQNQYMPTAMEPYTMEGSVYGLPQTEVFDMMFYRTDVLAELGLEPPETWEDVYRMISMLKRKNMEIGLPGDISLYYMLLQQHGGDLYVPAGTKTCLDREIPIDTFIEWCEIYTQYNFSLVKSDFDRFRSGEMPITIMPYTFYCQLMLAAPEIQGKWAMAPIPGVVQADGSVDRSQSSVSSTAMVMLKDSESKEAAWTFMKWFSSAEIQGRYGKLIEETLGSAARYTPSNVQAQTSLNWSSSEVSLLQAQWQSVNEIPEMPGAYYIARNLNNAFRGAVYSGKTPRDSLRQWNDEINREITRKRKDYDLATAQGN